MDPNYYHQVSWNCVNNYVGIRTKTICIMMGLSLMSIKMG